MPIRTIASGETVTVASGETAEDGPLYLDGTLQLEGTFELGETAIAATGGLGLTATTTIDGAISLRRVTNLSIDNTRRSDFTVQGVGDTDD